MPWNKPYHPPRNQRLDPELYRQVGRITFITIRAYLHAAPFVNESINQMIVDTLREEQERQHCAVYTYCLMPDHLHYLVGPVQEGVSVLVFSDQFKGKTTNRSWQHGWRGKLWQPRSYDHIVRVEEDLRQIAEYILNNPVRKGLVDHAEDWPWSGHLTPLLL
ncbi:MAG TPA: transposase [Anaerolineae bacterium]|nr:transposase [Anaerolineae bacterium]